MSIVSRFFLSLKKISFHSFCGSGIHERLRWVVLGHISHAFPKCQWECGQPQLAGSGEYPSKLTHKAVDRGFIQFLTTWASPLG